MSKPLRSANVGTNNVLLRVTVPKRTGLKRRRCADDSDNEGADARVSGERAAPMPDRYQVEAVGTIKQTHRFRGIRVSFP